MPIEFDFYASPNPTGDKKKENFHARVVNGSTVETQEIIENLEHKCTLSAGDIKAVLTELSQAIVKYLTNGDKVHLDEIGYFSLTLKAPKDSSPINTHSQNIELKSVTFRADKILKKRLVQKAKFKRTEQKKHSKQLDIYEIDSLLADFFYENRFLTRSRLEQLCGFTPSTAARHLRRLLKEGRLVNKNTRQNPVYEPGLGYYGR